MGAAYSGYTETVQVLLDGGANVGAQQDRGWTSLMFAADQGQAEAVRALLAEGAEVNAEDKDGWTADRGHAEVVQLLGISSGQ